MNFIAMLMNYLFGNTAETSSLLFTVSCLLNQLSGSIKVQSDKKQSNQGQLYFASQKDIICWAQISFSNVLTEAIQSILLTQNSTVNYLIFSNSTAYVYWKHRTQTK